jgi:type I restriction enzyme R subunit
MPTHRGTETTFELTTIERLEQLRYQHVFGPEIERAPDQVVLKDVLRASLAARYPDLPDAALDEAVARISRPDGVDTLRRNMAFHQMLTRGLELKVEFPDRAPDGGPNGRIEHRLIYPVDWEHPAHNDFRVVNQFPIHGQNDRRPDLVIFINGLPLVVFELKNPYAAEPTVDDALNQIQHYSNDIPQLFDTNALVVVSDGVTTLHGMWTASHEWYAPWKSIDGFDIEPNTTGSMKTLIEGLFPKDRLLAYIRDFIVFEVVSDKITKKGAKYHQFFAVRLAAAKAIETYKRAGAGQADRRIGVIWHTTGAGKSLSMAFLVGILLRQPELENPTFVIQVDRNDLDNQLHDQFVAARSLVGDVQHADSVDDLRRLLQTEGGGVIFTTIEKFRLKTDVGEIEHPELSGRSNIIVIADEAHRSQYGFTEGYARNLTEALPHAMRLGFTGTPVSLSSADTVQVFGDVIHTYDIGQSQQDHATVPIYYEPRQIKVRLSQADIDAALDEITQGQEMDEVEQRKGRWAALAAAAGAKDRLDELARDLLAHFLDRTATLRGKAMAVCMTRENCVRLYDALTALPDCPEVKIVMTGNLSEDPPEWSAAGHLTTKAQREAIKQRMITPDDPLKLVIVCDMWLTGTDIPCLHTLYVDKPMQGHNMIQAISRVNRVFRDKPHGLIVDYIGIGDELREATAKYTQGGGKGDPAPDIESTARPLFLAELDSIRALLPAGHDYGAWRRMTPIEMEDLYALVYGHLADDTLRDHFLQAELRLSSAFLLVKHLDDCRKLADEVIFYQRVRQQSSKLSPGTKPRTQALDRAVRDLVDEHVASEGAVDIFQAAGLERADISILDDQFLQTFKDRPQENLRLKLLQRLVENEIQLRRKQNITRARSFKELLEATLQKYHNRLIDAAEVVRVMIQIRQDMAAEEQRARALGLDADELAFYDAVAVNFFGLYDEAFLRDLIHDVVHTVKNNLKVDWTEPHREDVHSTVRAAVRRELRRRNVRQQDLEPFLGYILDQAKEIYADWPVGAYASVNEEQRP